MMPCKICTQPKTYHDWYFIHGSEGHEFSMDNLAFLEKKIKAKEREDKHRKLNFCQICNQVKKSPFGICNECSASLIAKNSNKALV